MRKGGGRFPAVIVIGYAIFFFGIQILAIFEPAVRPKRLAIVASVGVGVVAVLTIYNWLAFGRFFPGFGADGWSGLHRKLVQRMGWVRTVTFYLIMAVMLVYGA